MPWFRTSWCMRCDWHGLHRHPRVTATSDSAIPRATEPVGRRH
jgi:hypothetical protein